MRCALLKPMKRLVAVRHGLQIKPLWGREETWPPAAPTRLPAEVSFSLQRQINGFLHSAEMWAFRGSWLQRMGLLLQPVPTWCLRTDYKDLFLSLDFSFFFWLFQDFCIFFAPFSLGCVVWMFFPVFHQHLLISNSSHNVDWLNSALQKMLWICDYNVYTKQWRPYYPFWKLCVSFFHLSDESIALNQDRQSIKKLLTN